MTKTGARVPIGWPAILSDITVRQARQWVGSDRELFEALDDDVGLVLHRSFDIGSRHSDGAQARRASPADVADGIVANTNAGRGRQVEPREHGAESGRGRFSARRALLRIHHDVNESAKTEGVDLRGLHAG